MRVTALAGGIGAGKFLRGLVRVVGGGHVTAIVNTAADVGMHGLHGHPHPGPGPACARVAARCGVASRVLPMSDDPVTTRVEVLADGGELDLHFQEYWVRRHARDEGKHVRYAGATAPLPR